MFRSRTPIGELPKLAYTITEFHHAGGPGRSRTYELIAAGRLRAVKDGSRTIIPVDEAQRYIGTLPPVRP